MGKLAITGGKALRKKAFTRWPIPTKAEAAALKGVLESTVVGRVAVSGEACGDVCGEVCEIAYGEVRAVREHGDGSDSGGAEGDRD